MANYDLVLAHWSKVQSNLEGYGGEALTRLFNKYPETKQLFPNFAEIPSDQLAGNKDIAAHGAIVLKKLGQIVQEKGSKDAVDPLAKTHAEKHKISIENFKRFSVIVVELFAEKGLFPAPALDALRKVLDEVIGKIGCFYKEFGGPC